ncbi:MAG: lysine-sensitive aspartokinase 3 [Candidatus Kapabacteria bacterium]|nr:lysine-sensitive aspartokinase 3 [Ignavibacteriota bacterium]MCW5884523.1 lysine-sensitive aspartokinase 3 [Candidatus Kapabacteria bacterium]
MIVMKFGGTSVKDAEAIKRTVSIVKSRRKQSIVVVSAFAGITNSLVELIDSIHMHQYDTANDIIGSIKMRHLLASDDLGITINVAHKINTVCDNLSKIVYALDIIGEVSSKSKDMILASGEILSSFIVAEYAKNIIDNVIHIDSGKLIQTDSNFTNAEVDIEQTNKQVNNFLDKTSKFDVAICGGFIAEDKNGNQTTLGRGGSDYSAAIIAQSLGADVLEIWTDVDGILTSDPRMIQNAMLLREISYLEAAELAYFGAKVLHPKTIYPAINAKIPVYVLNSFKPNGNGTLITEDSPYSNIIKAIAFRKNITIINVTSNRMLGAYGFLAKVFDVFLLNETSVDLVTTSEVSISLTIDNDGNLDNIIKDLSHFATTDVYKGRAIISVVGEGIRDTAGIASRFFVALNGVNIYMISMGASEINLSIVVSEKDLEKSVKLLHKEFFENENLPDLFVKLNEDN